MGAKKECLEPPRELSFEDVKRTLSLIKNQVLEASEAELGEAEDTAREIFHQYFTDIRTQGDFFLVIGRLLVVACEMIKRERLKCQ